MELIDSIRGKVERVDGEEVVVNVGPVSLKVHCDLRTISELSEGDEVELRTVVVFGEEPRIFGFSDELKRRVFEKLMRVSKVGPKYALRILSHAEVSKIVEMISNGDVEGLQAIPGIGKKTAERIVAELKDDLPKVETEGSHFDEAVSALVNLGYRRSEAVKAVRSAYKPGMDLAEIVKESLKVIGKL